MTHQEAKDRKAPCSAQDCPVRFDSRISPVIVGGLPYCGSHAEDARRSAPRALAPSRLPRFFPGKFSVGAGNEPRPDAIGIGSTMEKDK